jgi:N-acetylmuramoyl-L-alanine amidase
MKFQTRADWNARPPKWRESIPKSKGVFIHYNGPAVSNSVAQGDYQSVRTFLQGIQNYHMNTQGWPDIAYSWCVDAVGRIWELRGWGIAGAHTLNHNWDSHAIFLPLGGNQAPTPEQIASCKIVIAEHNKRYGTGFVKGHQDAPNSTSCPGPVVLPMVRRGDFNPTPQQQQIIDPLKGETKMNPPVMMRNPNGEIWIYYTYPESTLITHPDGKTWVYYQGTPYRQEVRKQDIPTFKFFGLKEQKLDANQIKFFDAYSVTGQPTRIHVKTPADVKTFEFLGIKPPTQLTQQQVTFFQRYHKAVK